MKIKKEIRQEKLQEFLKIANKVYDNDKIYDYNCDDKNRDMSTCPDCSICPYNQG